MTTDDDRDPFVEYLTAVVDAVTLATRDPLGLPLFLATHGRLPRLSDDRKPWTFRGWMLPAVMDMVPTSVGCPKVGRSVTYAGRWGWWYRVQVTGELPPDAPVPPSIEFGHGGSAARSNVERCVSAIGHRVGFSSGVGGLVDWLAWALGVAADPPRFDDDLHEELYRTFCVDHWFAEPSDYLGWVMSEHKGRGKDPTAFFPTPHSVVTAAVQMTMGERTPEKVKRSVMDPCVGTGRFLLEASNWSVRLYGMDINPRCVAACKVNGAVYAPWISFPFVGLESVREGNALGATPDPPVWVDESGQGLLFDPGEER